MPSMLSHCYLFVCPFYPFSQSESIDFLTEFVFVFVFVLHNLLLWLPSLVLCSSATLRRFLVQLLCAALAYSLTPKPPVLGKFDPLWFFAANWALTYGALFQLLEYQMEWREGRWHWRWWWWWFVAPNISQTSNGSSSGSRWARTKTKTYLERSG